MIYLKDLFRLQLDNLRIVAGTNGTERTVTAAVLFEYDPSRMKTPDFYRGDLVVTTLAYAREDIQLVSQSMLALMEQGVAGFLVKTAYFQSLPEVVIDRANDLQTPIFLFDNTYIEEVILRVTDLINNKNPFFGFEETLDQLMNGKLTSTQVKEKMRCINPESALAYGVVMIQKRYSGLQIEERLTEVLENNPDFKKKYILMSWHGKMIALCRLAEDDLDQDNYAKELVSIFETQEADYCIGISNICEDTQKIGVALNEAVYAARKAEIEGEFISFAHQLGIYAFLMPMTENDFVREEAGTIITRLRNFDRINKMVLTETVESYVINHFDIAETARALSQHPNTIRYRLGKVREFLGQTREKDFDMLIGIVVYYMRIVKED